MFTLFEQNPVPRGIGLGVIFFPPKFGAAACPQLVTLVRLVIFQQVYFCVIEGFDRGCYYDKNVWVITQRHSW